MERDEILKEFDSIREKIEGEVDIKSYIQEGRRHYSVFKSTRGDIGQTDVI